MKMINDGDEINSWPQSCDEQHSLWPEVGLSDGVMRVVVGEKWRWLSDPLMTLQHLLISSSVCVCASTCIDRHLWSRCRKSSINVNIIPRGTQIDSREEKPHKWWSEFCEPLMTKPTHPSPHTHTGILWSVPMCMCNQPTYLDWHLWSSRFVQPWRMVMTCS